MAAGGQRHGARQNEVPAQPKDTRSSWMKIRTRTESTNRRDGGPTGHTTRDEEARSTEGQAASF
eukprot:12071352-Heterocapsa_arctica.AAC.1